MSSNIATPPLVIVGVLMVVLGLFGGPEYVVMAMGLVSLIAAGILGVMTAEAVNG